jgi:tetratricopeptide (TPR) repeat protein
MLKTSPILPQRWRLVLVLFAGAYYLFAGGCSLSPFHRNTQIGLNSELKMAPDDLKMAVTLLEQREYDRALTELSEFLRKTPISAWTQVAHLNQAHALEGLERWTDAISKYREVIASLAGESLNGRAPQLRALALYRLSFCYEALGFDSEAVAALQDALKFQSFLDSEVAQAELPARLAAAYARVGNPDQADNYFNRAEAGIAKLKSDSSRRDLPEWLPRTLYFMGTMSLRRVTWDDFESSLRPLRRAQRYLLQAADLGQSPWSDRAAKDLISVYRDLWGVIEKAPLSTPEASSILIQRQTQERAWDLAAMVQEHIMALRAYQLPQAESSLQTQSILLAIDSVEAKIIEFYLHRPIGEGLTLESWGRKNRMPREIELNANQLK